MKMFRNATLIAVLLCGGSLFAATGQLITVTAIPGPANCANGGVQIDVGFDDGWDNINGVAAGTASDGILDPGEIDGTNYVCNGAPGAAGPAGADGALGPQGPAGADGAVGPQGPAGADGAIGPQGPAGADGAIGPQGPAGADGAVGPQGPAGADGAVGPQGPAGADGALGPQGPAGTNGTNGLAGLACWDINLDGIQDALEDINGDTFFDTLDCIGPQGQQGIPGTNGINGTNGTNGLDGLACWDLNLDGVADAEEDINEDTVWDTLDCIGPQGSKGDTGDTGSQGPQGIQGPQGPAGATGLNGLSCWDSDFDGIADPEEDINEDMVWNADDCIGMTGLKGDKGDPGTVGETGPQGTDGADGANGLNSLVVVTEESTFDNCDFGGNKIEAGLDINANGSLDAGESDATEYVCNGAAGADGEVGATGATGATGETGAPGTNGIQCWDSDGDGVGDQSEDTNGDYAWNGLDCIGAQGPAGAIGDTGSTGTDGKNALVVTTDEPAGMNCPNGGKRIQNGVDANSNDILEATEVETTEYVCNGVDGANGPQGDTGDTGATGNTGDKGTNALVDVSDELPGENCETGGTKINSGLDSDASGVLEAVEITSTRYVCNGAIGPVGEQIEVTGGGGCSLTTL